MLCRFGDQAQMWMLRTTGHKYVAFNSGARPEQLFDLNADPGETRNLVPEKASHKTLKLH